LSAGPVVCRLDPGRPRMASVDHPLAPRKETAMNKPIEAKVQAGTLSAAVAGIVLYLLQTYVFKDGMPQGVESLVYLAVPAILAGVAGYLAPHTSRPAAGVPPVAGPPGSGA